MNHAEIHRQKVMQLATQQGSQPWICTVYFVLRMGSFYWLSFPERRHSQELARSSRAAIAIAIKQDPPVIGIQAEGDAEVVEDMAEAEAVLREYIEKYDRGKGYMQRLKAGTNRHVLYRLTPRRTVLFDELHHPDDPYQTITMQ